MRDVRASLIARVKVGLHNPTEKWLRKDCSGAFSIKVKMYAGVPHEYIHKRAHPEEGQVNYVIRITCAIKMYGNRFHHCTPRLLSKR